jgi:hypothetical protein
MKTSDCSGSYPSPLVDRKRAMGRAAQARMNTN